MDLNFDLNLLMHLQTFQITLFMELNFNLELVKLLQLNSFKGKMYINDDN